MKTKITQKHTKKKWELQETDHLGNKMNFENSTQDRNLGADYLIT